MRKPSDFLKMLPLGLLLAGCSQEPSGEVQGYIEGEYTYIATSVSGILSAINVERGVKVKKGDVLALLDKQPESDLYTAALENLKQAENAKLASAAHLAYAKVTFERYKILEPKNAVEKSLVDNAKANYLAKFAELSESSARIASSRAALQQAKWTLNQKTFIAPKDGFVFDTYYRFGEFVEDNKPILALLAPQDIKVIFYITEPRLADIKINDEVSVITDGNQKEFKARVYYISPSAEYTPPIIYSNETNAKFIYRIEASFNLNEAYSLHPGQPVKVKYNYGG